MDVAAAYSGNAPSHEIPDGYASIVASHGKVSASLVEGAREGLTPRVQNPFIVLRGRREG